MIRHKLEVKSVLLDQFLLKDWLIYLTVLICTGENFLETSQDVEDMDLLILATKYVQN